MKKTMMRIVTGLVFVSLILAACTPATQAPTEAPTQAPATQAPATQAPATQPSGGGGGGKVCQVTDVGGVDDKSFNETSWLGAQQAAEEHGWEAVVLESQQQTDYERNINEFLQSDCDLIVTVGFLLGDATAAAATANPEQKFLIVDVAYDPPYDNVWAQVYAIDQPAFMAGYVAAAASQTGIVGTYGGINIPPVVSFMDGFAYGVAYYNEQHGAEVEVLGWDPENREGGLFTGNFESTDDGRRMAETLMDEGADVIMPVAGPVGLGTLAAVKERGNAYVIWVDTDGSARNPEYSDIILTSVEKGLDRSVAAGITAMADGSFEGGTHLGTLENGILGISPFYELDSLVPAEVKTELEQIKADIIAGTLQTAPTP
jgi:basic membrane protein A